MHGWMAVTVLVSWGCSSPAPPQGHTTAPAMAPLPEQLLCTGRWAGEIYIRYGSCDDATLAGIHDYDITVSGGAAGWSARVAKPAQARVTEVTVGWNRGQGDCSAAVEVAVGGTTMRYHFTRGGVSDIHIANPATGCRAQTGSHAPAVFVPDNAQPPLPPASRTAAVGSYDLAISWIGAACDVLAPPPGQLAFRLAIDHDASDRLHPFGLDGFAIDQLSLSADATEDAIAIRGSTLTQAPYPVTRLVLSFHGPASALEGDATYQRLDYGDAVLCKYTGRIHGRRR